MSTNSVVTFLIDKFPDWSVPRLIDIVDQVNKDIVGRNVRSMLVGGDVAESIVLSASPKTFPNIRKFVSIFTNDQTIPVNGVKWFDDVGSGAYVTADPSLFGTYRALYYRKPTPITSLNSVLDVPDIYHLSHVVYACSMYIEEFEHGVSEKRLLWDRKMLPRITSDLNESPKVSIVKGYV
jgi:hypothetical protein